MSAARSDDLARESEPWANWSDPQRPVRLGVSSCLLGLNVRYDGGHARSAFVAAELDKFVEWVQVCPEQEVGMGTPRPTIRLIQEDVDEEPRLIEPRSGEDWTGRMQAYARERVAELQALQLDGYVLKNNSPSCAKERLKVYRENGHGRGKHGVGVFSAVLQDALPDLPVEDEGRLNDPRLREHFVERVWCHNRWRVFMQRGATRRGLVAFHTAHKMLLSLHDEPLFRELGRIVAAAGETAEEELYARYGRLFARALRVLPGPGRHVNTLQHVMGHLKDKLTADEKQHILRQLDDYRSGLLPLLAPLSTITLLLERHGVEYMSRQLYLSPYPRQLAARMRL